MTEIKSPFDFVTSASSNKKYLMLEELHEKEYSPFLTNRAFSYHSDSILYAMEMNEASNLDHKLQYDFYFYSLRPRKRFSKWIKPEENSRLKIVMDYYQINSTLAKTYLKILTNEQLDELKIRLEKGGV